MTIKNEKAMWVAETEGQGLVQATIGEMLDRQSRIHADRQAIVFDEPPFGPAVSWTYAALKNKADELARGLLGIGISRGAHVAVLAPNSPEWILLEYAIAKVGAILVTVNTAYKASELRYLLRQGKIDTLFTVSHFRGHSFRDALQAGAPDAVDFDLPDLRRIVLIGDGEWPGAIRYASVLESASSISMEHLSRRQSSVGPADVSQIQFTSGTTGTPKGAMLTHVSTLSNALFMAERAGFGPTDRTISAMPLFHTAGCVCNVLGALVSGGSLIGMASFDASKMLHQIQKHRATVVNAVPTMFIRLLEDPDFGAGRIDCSSVRIAFTGGATIPPALMRELKHRLNAEPMIIMGMTETSPIITQTVNSDDFETRTSTAGTALPLTDIRIVGVDGQIVRCGEPGELQIRGYLLMKGYFGASEQTDASIDREGWLHSGDIAVLEQSGHLRIVGRTKDMIIRGGENIYPAEIEDLLVSHIAIAQAQVVGVEDREMGEEAFAFVLLRQGASASEDEVRAFCRERISRHKVPRYFAFVKDFPITASGKIKKFELRDAAARRLSP